MSAGSLLLSFFCPPSLLACLPAYYCKDTGELQEAQQYCSRLLDIGGQVDDRTSTSTRTSVKGNTSYTVMLTMTILTMSGARRGQGAAARHSLAVDRPGLRAADPLKVSGGGGWSRSGGCPRAGPCARLGPSATPLPLALPFDHPLLPPVMFESYVSVCVRS